MVSRLSIYNHAASILSEPRLLRLEENRPFRRECDAAFDRSVMNALESGNWNFAIRAVMIEATSDITPAFGHPYVFAKPDDHVRTAALSIDPYFREPFEDFSNEGDYWAASIETLYLRYVSKDPAYGFDPGKWTQKFADLVAYEMAVALSGPIQTNAAKREQLSRELKQARTDANAFNGANKPVKRFPEGRWTRARRGNHGRYRGRYS